MQVSLNSRISRMACAAFAITSLLFAQLSFNISALAAQQKDDVESRVSSLLGKMTLDEKIKLLSGDPKDDMHLPGVKRLGIPELKFSDGPVGVRVWGRTTAYPAGAMLASTWDIDAARAMGKALGRDSRARGVHVLLAPGCDLYRVPQCGRNFEYFGEDPFLSSKITVGYVQGVQSEHVATSVKHYAANDQEILRDSIDTIVDERRLHEICLPPFKAAVQEANAWTLMAAYNKVNGEWCTANSYLLTDVLRKQWGFKGVLMSDWGAVHDCLGPITAGTDLEMGHAVHYTADNIKRFLNEGKLTQEQIDEHVRRVLRMSVSLGFLDHEQEDKSIPLNDPTSADAALRVAREGLVLLKNDNEFLPLEKQKIKSIVVLGPNACPSIVCGGGSSQTDPFNSISLLDSIRKLAGDGVAVHYIPTWMGPNPTASSAFNAGALYEPVNPEGQRGFIAEYFSSTDLSGKPVVSRIENNVNYLWGSWHPVEQISAPTFSARFTGKIKAPQTDIYTLACNSDNARILMDGKPLFDTQGAASKTMKMEAGDTHEISIEYRHLAGPATVQFSWGKANKEFNEEENKQLKEADAVVAAIGLNNYVECEGFDRPYDLYPDQLDLLQRTAKQNTRLLAVLNAGGNLGVEKWAGGVAALMHAWYPGQNGNLAVAEAIFGELNPSGRLPDTFENRWEDSPAFGNYPGSSDNGGKLEYKEGIYVGYRWFDKKNISPCFPFGYGLSYTSFSMHDLDLKKSGSGIEATVNVTNTGKRDGTEVVQVYVRPLNSSIDRPVQELKGFARVALKAAETKSISIPLNAASFATYDARAHSWVSPDGIYEVAVGSSSRDIHCSQSIKWTEH